MRKHYNTFQEGGNIEHPLYYITQILIVQTKIGEKTLDGWSILHELGHEADMSNDRHLSEKVFLKQPQVYPV